MPHLWPACGAVTRYRRLPSPRIDSNRLPSQAAALLPTTTHEDNSELIPPGLRDRSGILWPTPTSWTDMAPATTTADDRHRPRGTWNTR